MEDIKQSEKKFQKAIDYFQNEIGGIRSSRPSPMLFERMMISAYGSSMPLVQCASITVSDPTTVVIDPWDKSLLKEIEKTIFESPLGFHPIVDGNIIRVSIPPLTSERREELKKILSQKSEHAKISIRGIREETLKEFKSQEKSGQMSEDDYFRLEKELQDTVTAMNSLVESLTEKKEKEIMTI